MQRYYKTVLDSFGNPATGCACTVTDSNTGSLATLYLASENLLDPASTISNPVVSGGDGKIAFAVAAGQYTLSFSGGNVTPFQETWVTLSDSTTGGSAVWGGITGTLSAQTDLAAALSAKAPSTSPTFTTSATFSFLTSGRVPYATTGGALTDSANFTYNGDTVTQIAGASGQVFSGSSTWNNVATTFTGWKLNITNTASASGSTVFAISAGGIDRLGLYYIGGNYVTQFQAIQQRNGYSSLDYDITGLALASTRVIGWTNGAFSYSTSDLFLAREAAANLRLGAAASATPVAQTISVQDHSGTDQAANSVWTFRAARGTGSGNGSANKAFSWTTPDTGTTGTTLQTVTEKMSLTNGGKLTLGAGGVDLAGDITFTQAATCNIFGTSGQNLNIRPQGAGVLGLYGTQIQVMAGPICARTGSFHIYATSAAQIGWGSTSDNTGTNDTILMREAAANVRLGAAASATPVAQTLSVQNASGTNISAVNWTLKGSLATGSGTAGKIMMAVDNGTNPGAAIAHSSMNLWEFGYQGAGYTTGAGGSVTQATSRTTGVTLNTPCGAITLVSAAGTTTWQTFTVTNSTVAATDTIIVCQKSGTDLNEIHVTAVAAGSFNISFRTTGGTTTEQPVFNFAVIKAVTA